MMGERAEKQRGSVFWVGGGGQSVEIEEQVVGVCRSALGLLKRISVHVAESWLSRMTCVG